MNNSEFKKGQEVWAKFKVKDPKIDKDGEVQIFNESGRFTWAKPEEIVTEIPEKPVIAQFVADWLESVKDLGFGLRMALEHWDMDEKLEKWMQYSDNQEIFAKAWLDGYEVEQEKLYTVELPDPNRKGANQFYLGKADNTGKVFINKGKFNRRKNKNLWLTEEEIRKDFEWAWEAGFAKPVEVKK